MCRIRALPDLYSHLGSQGMPVITILQSWSREPLFGIADLQALERGHEALLSSGNPAALVATIP